MRPAFLLARTHFILRKKDRSISYSAQNRRKKKKNVHIFPIAHRAVSMPWVDAYHEQSVNGKAGVLWGQQSFHRGLQDGCTHKCCFPLTLPVNMNILLWHITTKDLYGDHIMLVKPTCDRPKWTDAVSDMYIIFPSGATTKMKPSSVWKNNIESVVCTEYKKKD